MVIIASGIGARTHDGDDDDGGVALDGCYCLVSNREGLGTSL